MDYAVAGSSLQQHATRQRLEIAGGGDLLAGYEDLSFALLLPTAVSET